SIRASGLTAAQTGRTHDRTRPMLQQREKVLAKAPSTHDPKRTSTSFWNSFELLDTRRLNYRMSRPDFRISTARKVTTTIIIRIREQLASRCVQDFVKQLRFGSTRWKPATIAVGNSGSSRPSSCLKIVPPMKLFDRESWAKLRGYRYRDRSHPCLCPTVLPQRNARAVRHAS